MLSAIVLTHTDSDILDACLSSLKGLADEIIVVDDASTDTTRGKATKYTPHVFVRSLTGDFSKQRNFGLSKAAGDWILFVDSDEVVPPELANEIRQTMINQKGKTQKTNGYMIKRKDFFLGKWLRYGETSRVRLVRLAKKGAGVWERPVHEVWNIEGTIGELSQPLHHFPHPNVAQFIDDINRYSTLNAQYLYAQGIRVPWWHIVAYPTAKFLLNYFVRFGFLDGTAGAVVAIMMSLHSFLTRAKLWLLVTQKRA